MDFLLPLIANKLFQIAMYPSIYTIVSDINKIKGCRDSLTDREEFAVIYGLKELV
jgi:hypothetical protein